MLGFWPGFTAGFVICAAAVGTLVMYAKTGEDSPRQHCRQCGKVFDLEIDRWFETDSGDRVHFHCADAWIAIRGEMNDMASQHAEYRG